MSSAMMTTQQEATAVQISARLNHAATASSIQTASTEIPIPLQIMRSAIKEPAMEREYAAQHAGLSPAHAAPAEKAF